MSAPRSSQILALLPARGGSKSVPGKNLKLLAGKPLISYAIAAARASACITRVIVSTDADAIARVAQDAGAEVPFRRPAELAGDLITDLPVFQHCLAWLEEHEGYRPDVVVHLRPTAPLRTAAHIDAGIRLLLENPGADAVRSVTVAGQHPLKMWRVEGGRLVPYLPEEVFGIAEPYNRPRQELPPAYVQNGSVDVVWTHVIREQQSMTGRRILALVMREEESVNIDSPLDWALAERLLAEQERNRPGSARVPG